MRPLRNVKGIHLACLATAISGLVGAKGFSAESTNEAVLRAMASVKEASARAQADPTRPVYHVLSPANWINDPNGPIYFKGHYHLFYQHNPYGDQWGHMHWGHVRSRDLARWEHLPIALWPSKDAGEEHVFSGCATIVGRGRPMIFYTSIARGKSATEYAEQWAAVPRDDDLITWQKHPANPVLHERLHGDVKVYDWRDPFVFQEKGVTYMVLGGNLNNSKGGQAVVNLYQAENRQLTQWKYLGVLFTHPDPKVGNIECPNFFKLDDKWVLIVSPHGKVEYFVGDFDASAHRFASQRQGLVDHSEGFYAPNTLLNQKDRRLMWGWIRGFRNGLGWNGCLTVPRVLSLTKDGELRQEPAPQLKKLRGHGVRAQNIRLRDSKYVLSATDGSSVELLIEVQPGNAKAVGLRLNTTGGNKKITISFDGSALTVGGTRTPFQLQSGERTLKLHLFLDRSILEVFVNNRACLTRVLEGAATAAGVELFAEGGETEFRSIGFWPMRSIW